ncbi:nicotinate-nucleotide--dimethylbenzimidazole phosphoribosyltransferase [Pseudonocardia sp.]|uniref:nicotinate-nucleotide--dimethylbenzimidazole phosphoribosyltransferase n=1 Tax=Pseudonocardia sp. TaxID=60912 RepID=UPI00262D0125|nr:nicotinate-nucleotide--dimethylbenzimidazole phosphoribosyltransferase [Pseudonocardia sp.]MCW2719422.1 Nicotinate-nucleotide--dimethylbenzimidazole phosphoribosyltransferase [Pseudonocardia sp.]MDT7616818.1 nicotinate-nucleotide--dimethylbenzimidazole phosphoribosyltransferase [Pseudonocardiales bacterium]
MEFYDVVNSRRDVRSGFRPDQPVSDEALHRILAAAHAAPSVGFSQPWDFLILRDRAVRERVHSHVAAARAAYAASLPAARAAAFRELKVEAILDTPLNIVVTCDPTRGGRHTLGRHTQPLMAPYSAVGAVQNLWLAARAEGLGVGWVSFGDERTFARELGIPPHLEVVAYLCVGHVAEFGDEPELATAGWARRRPLGWAVHHDTFGRRGLPGAEPTDLLAETVAAIAPPDAAARAAARDRLDRMTMPRGALGRVEEVAVTLSGIARACPPPVPEPAAVAVFAGDHGVHAQGVTHWPQEVTAQMVANFLSGGAVVNAFARQLGAEVCVVDVGVAAPLDPSPGLLPRRVADGTADMAAGPALTREQAQQAVEVGIETARDLVAAGNRCLITGDMGIANTTAAAALICTFTGADPALATGRGTGIDDAMLVRKTDVVRRALELHHPDPADPLGVLAAFGGLEHAALAGFVLGAAATGVPVLLDGVNAGAAALVAAAFAPDAVGACLAGHRSAEPGHRLALAHLGVEPLLDLDMRLGEGTGALLALPVVQGAARALHDVATFDAAGVVDKN